jgi:hypothetical protein
MVVIDFQLLVALGSLLAVSSAALGYSIGRWEIEDEKRAADPTEHGPAPL